MTSCRTFNIYVEAVHRLSNLGVVVTMRGMAPRKRASTPSGERSAFHGRGDLISRSEIFDEADLDAALARFDELQPQTPRLENAASQVDQRFLTYFAARDWDAYAEILSDDVRIDDRRHVVNAGVRHGRDAEIANLRAVADIGVTNITSTVIAIRGRRLALSRIRVSDGGPRKSSTRCSRLEINAENQIVARVAFDSNESTLPSRSSTPGTSPAKQPPTRTRGRPLGGLHRVQPARISRDSGLGQHRSSAR